MIPGSILTPVGLLLAGWSAQNHLHWAVTDLVYFPKSCSWTTNADSAQGNLVRWCWNDLELPIHPGVRFGHVHSPRCVRPSGCLLPAVYCWFWIPFVCARHVCKAGIWEGYLHTGCRIYRSRLSCVSYVPRPEICRLKFS